MHVFIVGATATGKSRVAVTLAEKIGGEIICADSMQIYRKMDIGTAKIKPEERRRVPHYMLDSVEPDQNFTVAEFSKKARKIINDIEKRKKCPIIVGGTGLYVNSLLYDYRISPTDPVLRAKIEEEYNRKGGQSVYKYLLSVDPSAKCLDYHDKKRVVRALEVYLLEGKSIFAKNDRANPRPHIMYASNLKREILYRKIGERTDKMFDDGLLVEIVDLINSGLSFTTQSMQAIGYKEFEQYFENKITLEEVKENIKTHTKNYAKRQLTWFRKIQSCKWADFEDIDAITDKIAEDYYKNKPNL